MSCANTDTVMGYCRLWLTTFCSLVNDDTGVVMIKYFAPLNVGHLKVLCSMVGQ